jgi:peptidoglycan/LPS O-acetylase OafA/YrhL
MRLDRASDLGRKANNFDVLRLAAATFVVFFHSFELTKTTAPLSFFSTATNVTWGTTGVLIFFAISGYLIARSWTYDPRAVSYAVKRALRLLPALVISLFITAFVIGPLVTTLPVSEYLQQPGTKAYVVLNSAMWTVYQLPGVFTSNVTPDAVNGSLWTLPVEVKAYVLIALIGVAGVFRRRSGTVVVVAIAVLASLWTIDSVRHALPLGDRAVAMLVNTQASSALVEQASNGTYNEWAKVFAAFVIGTALFSLRRWVWLRWDLVALAAAIWGITIAISADAAGHAFVFLLPFVVLMIAYRTSQWFRLPQRFGDYSYGVYILAFPIQQAISHWIAPASGWAMFAIAMPITLALAALSWHLIEAPALTLKKYIAVPLDAAVARSAHPAPRAELDSVGAPD